MTKIATAHSKETALASAYFGAMVKFYQSATAVAIRYALATCITKNTTLRRFFSRFYFFLCFSHGVSGTDNCNRIDASGLLATD